MLIHLSIQGHTNVKHSNLNGKESWFKLYIKDITNLQPVRMNIKLKSQLMFTTIK